MSEALLQAVLDGALLMSDESADRVRVWASARQLGAAGDSLYLLQAEFEGETVAVQRLDVVPTSGLPSMFPEWTIKPENASPVVLRALALTRRSLAVRTALLANPVMGEAGFTFATATDTLVATAGLGLVSVSRRGHVTRAYEPLQTIAATVAVNSARGSRCGRPRRPHSDQGGPRRGAGRARPR